MYNTNIVTKWKCIHVVVVKYIKLGNPGWGCQVTTVEPQNSLTHVKGMTLIVKLTMKLKPPGQRDISYLPLLSKTKSMRPLHNLILAKYKSRPVITAWWIGIQKLTFLLDVLVVVIFVVYSSLTTLLGFYYFVHTDTHISQWSDGLKKKKRYEIMTDYV